MVSKVMVSWLPNAPLATQPVPPEAPAEMRQLVQELQVHQIELEMQYEELLLAQLVGLGQGGGGVVGSRGVGGGAWAVL